MGAEVEQIFKMFRFDATGSQSESRPEDNFDIVLKKFNSYFMPQLNVIHERAKFHSRVQHSDESMEQYISALYELAANCQFSDKDETIRDRLVLGLIDKQVSQKLQLKKYLSLQTAIETARHHEMVKVQLSDQSNVSADSVKVNASHHQAQAHSFSVKGEGDRRDFVNRCGKCGQSHLKTKCPAQNKACHHCGKNGHLVSVCRQRRRDVHSVMQNETVSKSYTFDSILSTVTEPPWRVIINIHNVPINFKIDTGADVNVISKATFNKISPRPKLVHSTATLRSPGGYIQNL